MSIQTSQVKAPPGLGWTPVFFDRQVLVPNIDNSDVILLFSLACLMIRYLKVEQILTTILFSCTSMNVLPVPQLLTT